MLSSVPNKARVYPGVPHAFTALATFTQAQLAMEELFKMADKAISSPSDSLAKA